MKRIIRKAKESEISAIIELAKTLFKDLNFIGARILVQQEDYFFVAEERGVIVGFVHIIRVNGKAIIKGLGVAREFQNKGIGNELMEYTLAKLKDEDEIYLKVKEENLPAISLYTRYGFFLKKYGKGYILVKSRPN